MDTELQRRFQEMIPRYFEALPGTVKDQDYFDDVIFNRALYPDPGYCGCFLDTLYWCLLHPELSGAICGAIFYLMDLFPDHASTDEGMAGNWRKRFESWPLEVRELIADWIVHKTSDAELMGTFQDDFDVLIANLDWIKGKAG